ncbi:nucleotidyl transferase AbiEii/AbiGii toxin family protein [Candidatus Gottesmanbacteria bacterium]|nr:nucleotidyl transferase AbiEii/AbiGii toxin family protein [Candidatus Gottesmanbacteria bacterium]
MGQTILTPNQSAVVECAQNDQSITRWFYLTGGTALTAFHLRHRLSEDLDFFTESEVSLPDLRLFFANNLKRLNIKDIKEQEHPGMVFFYLTFMDNTTLKVDFVNFPYRPVEQGTLVKGLRIDSVFDIALNKLYTLSDRLRARDYVDLYCILTFQGISLGQVYERLNDKFYPFTFQDRCCIRG